jgi:hypothetical protein
VSARTSCTNTLSTSAVLERGVAASARFTAKAARPTVSICARSRCSASNAVLRSASARYRSRL